MKKFSEMQFKKPNLKKIEGDFNKMIEELEGATCFEDQDKVLKRFFKYAKVLFLLKIGEILKTVPSMREEQDDIYVRV